MGWTTFRVNEWASDTLNLHNGRLVAAAGVMPNIEFSEFRMGPERRIITSWEGRE